MLDPVCCTYLTRRWRLYSWESGCTSYQHTHCSSSQLYPASASSASSAISQKASTLADRKATKTTVKATVCNDTIVLKVKPSPRSQLVLNKWRTWRKTSIRLYLFWWLKSLLVLQCVRIFVNILKTNILDAFHICECKCAHAYVWAYTYIYIHTICILYVYSAW